MAKTNRFANFATRTMSQAKKAQQEFRTYGFVAPDGFKIWKPKKNEDSKHTFRVIPYIITKAGHPDGMNDDNFPGEGGISYRRPYATHNNVGENKTTVVCPKLTFGKPCPICEERARLFDIGAPEKQTNVLRPVRKVLMAILRKGEEEIEIFDFSKANFANVLEKEIASNDNPDVAGFALPDGGMNITVRFGKDSYEGNDFVKAERIDFVPSKENLGEDIVDSSPAFDDCLPILSYKELFSLFFGTDEIEGAHKEEKGTVEEDKPKEEKKTTRQIRKVTKEEKVEEKVKEAKAKEEPEEEAGFDDSSDGWD